MANVIIPNQERRADAEFIMKSYGVDRNNSAMGWRQRQELTRQSDQQRTGGSITDESYQIT